MVKDAPNYVPMNMLGLDQTSHEIIEDVDVPIFPVVLSTLDYLQSSLNHYCDRSSISLSTFCAEFNTICIYPYIQYQLATCIWLCRRPRSALICEKFPVLKCNNVHEGIPRNFDSQYDCLKIYHCIQGQ